jgi:extracellular elastinolytic metalloproteinase
VVASPAGWLGAGTTTTGNNVDAYLDRDANDLPDVNGRPTGPGQIFDFAWDGTVDPTTAVNQNLSVTNLFYLTNLIHDRLYSYGFTESAGNFQTDNFGRGGLENDPLNAEAQDGGGADNANFATPEDGQRPRMQMYLWDRSAPGRDGALDSDIVFHEYTHGLTWRMVGDMSGTPASAVGEGMSDAIACYFNNDDRVAEWSSNTSIGIRSAPYTNYTRTYGQVVGILGPHLDGEIYAATLWRLRQLWLGKGWSQATLLRYLVDGLNYTPPKPAYEQMRDGILSSIQQLPTGLDKQQATCTVWDAFAQFGIGVGASGQEICVIGLCLFKGTESFTKPASCGGQQNAAPTVQISSPANNASFASGASIVFTGTASDTEDGTLTASLSWTSSLQGALGTGGSFTRTDLAVGTHVITAAVTDTQGTAGSATITIVVTAPNTGPSVSISQPANGTTFTKGQAVTFSGSASDAQDGNLTASIAWTSSLQQGVLGTGATFSRSDLVVGTHVISAKVTDSGNLSQTAQLTITISNFTLAATKSTVRGKRQVGLAWSGATGTTVGIYRDNALLVTAANSGTYTDGNLPKKGNTFAYKVCLAATPSVCSNSVSVTF